jgi:hypothetical protein
MDAKTADKWITLDTPFEDYNISREPTLRIIDESIKVIKAKSVSYKTESFDIIYTAH